MKVLVLGASGMLGRAVVRRLAGEPGVETSATFHQNAPWPPPVPIVLAGINLRDFGDICHALAHANPHVVVNCAGLVPQRAGFGEPTAAIEMNALLPHRLAVACRDIHARLIHISTDCVFSGARTTSPWPSEYAIPDPVDLYGRSKLLGEVIGPNQLTLRMSLFGREAPGRKQGLLEWFLSQPRDSDVDGYTNALFTGLATPVAADLIARIITQHADLAGLYHAAAPTGISKCDLLTLFRAGFDHPVRILPREEPRCDRRLDGSELTGRIGWTAPSWPEQVAATLLDHYP